MIAGAGAFAVVAILMGLGVLALPWWTPLAVFAVGVGVALPFEAANVYGHAVAGVSPTARILPWIGNGVLDRFLEDESLFGEFLRTPVSEGGVEPLVVEPPHVVVEVGA